MHLKGAMGASKGTKFVLTGGLSEFEVRDDTYNQPIPGFLCVCDYLKNFVSNWKQNGRMTGLTKSGFSARAST